MALNGERMELADLLERAGEIGPRHGVGIVDHVEDRIVGLKVRDLYEVSAAAVILIAHKELEKLVGTIHQNTFKPHLDDHWAYLVYAGLWYEPLLSDGPCGSTRKVSGLWRAGRRTLKLEAAATVLLVLVGGLVAAKAAMGGDE